MGDADPDAADPFDPAHVAPAAAWLVSDAARHVTGRVFEVGGGTLSIADGWRPAGGAALPDGASVGAVGALLDELVAGAPTPRGVLRPELGRRAALTRNVS